MKPEERKLWNHKVASRRVATKRAIKEAELKAALKAVGCTHPKEALVEFRWEHDNGYGLQSWSTGLRCLLCEAKCYYPGLSPRLFS